MSRNGFRGVVIFFTVAALLLAAGPVFVTAHAEDAQPGAEQAIETMIQAIKEDNAPIRNRMFFRIRDIGEPAVDPLIAAYAANSELPVRQYIINMLSWVGGDKAYEFVTGKITDPLAEIRQKAAEGICTMDATQGIPLLIQALEDQDPNVRIAAIVSLGVLVFYDTGFVWDEGQSIDLADLRHAVGTGLRIALPAVAGTNVLRLTWGFPLGSGVDSLADSIFIVGTSTGF